MPQNVNSGGRFFGRLSAAGSEAEAEIIKAAATVKIEQPGLPILEIITAAEPVLTFFNLFAGAESHSHLIISGGGCLLGAGPRQQPKQQQQQPVLRRQPKQQHHVHPHTAEARATPSNILAAHPSHSITLSCTPPSLPSPVSLFPVPSASAPDPHSPDQSSSPTAVLGPKDHDPSQPQPRKHQDNPHIQDFARKRNAFLDMLAWLRGDQAGEDDEVDNDLIIDPQEEELDPETPGPAAFAFNAFRTGLFGTPKPNLDAPERERQPRPRLGREAMSDEDVFTSSRKRQSSRSPGRFLTFEDAMTPPRKNPQSILVTPGNTISKKKTVSFGPDQFHEDTICYETRTGRIRSGLPSSYPGKFPSPWTPKVTNDFPKKRAKDIRVDDIEIFEDQAKPLKSAQKSRSRFDKDTGRDFALTSKPRDEVKSVDEQINALRENTARINDMIGEAAEEPVHDGDVTVNLDEPRSRSGVYWKERYSTDINQAEKKVEFYKARKDTTIEFASKKDEQCANLAARLKEEMELRRKMQAEIDRWQKLAMENKHEPVTTINAPVSESYQQKTIERLRKETAEYREIIRQKEVEMNDSEYQIDRQRSEIDRQARRIKDLEAALKTRKEAATEASMNSSNAESEIRNLKRELRKAEVAASGKDLLSIKFESSQREVERLRQQLTLVKEENQRLKDSQKSAHNTTIAALDRIPIVTTIKETRHIEPLSGSQTRETRPPPPPPSPESPLETSSPKITEQSAFPNVSLVESQPQIGGIFSNPTQLPRMRDVIPIIDQTLREEDEEDSNVSLPGQSKPETLESAPKPLSPIKHTPITRKPALARTPIMTEKEIIEQLENTDLSLPPFSPTMGSMSDIDLDKLKSINKPPVRRSKEDLINGNKQITTKSNGADRPRTSEELPKNEPMADQGPPKYDTDNEVFSMRRAQTSPMPKMFNFEKTPNRDRRGSFTSLRAFVNTKIIKKPSTLDMGSNPALLKTVAAAATSNTVATGVAIATTKSSPSDTDARRQLAAARMAEMKARMKAANKEARS
ncbi:hypothetical protein ABW21_db0200903 [Orbilia brochopaga]|nr:hypothetical protein ABW21_db0200903 [Drechslerella brochopaga]